MNTDNPRRPDETGQDKQPSGSGQPQERPVQKTLNLDTGEEEDLLPPEEDENIMDFGSGSGGGSAGDGGAA